MILSPYLLTKDDEITVVSARSSVEVEYVLLCRGEEQCVTVGSDHTDRQVEIQSVPASKQMYAKCLAPEAWPYQEVREHWDEFILRSRVSQGRERTLYHAASLSSILSPAELLKELPPPPICVAEPFLRLPRQDAKNRS